MVFDDLYDIWDQNVFVAGDTTPLNWYQIDMSQEEVGIYKIEIIKRLDRPLRFAVCIYLQGGREVLRLKSVFSF